MQSKKSRILMIHQGAELYGSDRIFLLLVTALCSDYSVDILVNSDGPLIGKLQNLDVNSVQLRDLSVVRRSEIGSPKAMLRFVFRFFSSVFWLVKLQKTNKYSCVYVNTLAVVSPVFIRLFDRKIKVIHHIHEIQSHPRTLVRCLYFISHLFSHRVFVVSDAVESHICSILELQNKSKIIKIHNGIPDYRISEKQILHLQKELDETFGGDSNQKRRYIAMVGRLHTWKGQLQLLDSILYASKHIPDLVIVFFGDIYQGYEYLKDEIDRKVSDLGLDSNVLFMGERTDADVLFGLCGISLMPSTMPDPFPTVVLESMREECVVIAYDHGGVCEMVENEESGLLVTVNDHEQFAKAIIDVCDNSVERSRLAANARKKFEKDFTEETFSKNILTEVNKLL